MSVTGARLAAHPGPVVWVVSSEHWPRACLRAELIERGHHALGFETVADARWALESHTVPRPSVTVVDLAGQTADADGLVEFVAEVGTVLAVAGAVDAHSRVHDLPWAAFLTRPVSLGAVADAVGGLLTGAFGSAHAP